MIFSLLGALIASLIIYKLFRTRGPLLDRVGNGSDVFPDPQGDMLLHAYWFIHMRWYVIVALFLLADLSCNRLHALPTELFPVLMFLTLALVSANIFWEYILKRGGDCRRLISFQVFADLAFLFAFAHFSGGVESPLVFLAPFHVVIAGILLSRSSCYWTATYGTLLFILMAMMEFTGLLDHYTLSIFPHGQGGMHGHGDSAGEALLIHASLSGTWVASRILIQALVMHFIAYLTNGMSEQLRFNHSTAIAKAAQASDARDQLLKVVDGAGAAFVILEEGSGPVWTGDTVSKWNNESLKALEERFYGILREGDWPTGSASEECRDGSGRVFRLTVFQLSQSPQRLGALVQEVTFEAEARARMAQQSRMAALGEMAGNIAHEINNPIGIICSKSRLLLSLGAGKDKERILADIVKIRDLADRATGITRGLLEFSRPSDSPRIGQELEPIIRETLALMASTLSQNDIRLKFALSPGIAAHVNRGEVEQILMNLVGNSVRAMEEGGFLKLSSERVGEWAKIIVQDTGSGVSKDIRERIFEPFFTSRSGGGGTGLGLSICKGLAKSNGGSLELEENGSVGSRFVLMFPIHRNES